MWVAYAGASARSQLQYRTSFVIQIIGQFAITAIDFVAVWALFDRFGALEGWTLGEVALFYGTTHMALALADLVGKGFDHAGDLIRMGKLDRILLRPRTTVLQLMGYDFSLRRLGRFAQGALVFAWAVPRVDMAWTIPTIALLTAVVVSGACLFLGLFILQATLSIWTVQSVEMVNATTYGGVAAAQYPLSIYERWFRRFFTFLVPLACVAYFPLVTALGKPDPLGFSPRIGAVSWIVGPLFLAGALMVWNWGVRQYTSTGS